MHMCESMVHILVTHQLACTPETVSSVADLPQPPSALAWEYVSALSLTQTQRWSKYPQHRSYMHTHTYTRTYIQRQVDHAQLLNQCRRQLVPIT